MHTGGQSSKHHNSPTIQYLASLVMFHLDTHHVPPFLFLRRAQRRSFQSLLCLHTQLYKPCHCLQLLCIREGRWGSSVSIPSHSLLLGVCSYANSTGGQC